MPYAFTDRKEVTKSHILVVNIPQIVEVPKGSSISIRQKRERSIGVKDKNSWKTKSNKKKTITYITS